YLPRLENLEGRLAPGDMLVGLAVEPLLASSLTAVLRLDDLASEAATRQVLDRLAATAPPGANPAEALSTSTAAAPVRTADVFNPLDLSRWDNTKPTFVPSSGTTGGGIVGLGTYQLTPPGNLSGNVILHGDGYVDILLTWTYDDI